MKLRLLVVLGCLTACTPGCGDDDDGGGDPIDGGARSDGAPVTDGGGGNVDAAIGSRPHPLYPALDLNALPNGGRSVMGPYEVPMLPATTRSVTVAATGAAAATELQTACATAGTAVRVPAAAGSLGTVNLGNVNDCDITLEPAVQITFLFIGNLPGPTLSPSHRIRVRGGQLGNLWVAERSSDVVLDGVIINNAIAPPATRAGTGIYLINGVGVDDIVNRFAMVNSIIRMLPTAPMNGDTDGCGVLAGRARNVLFANNNIATAGNRNSWGFRLGGGYNWIIIDNTVRVSFHKLVRVNDADVDFLYIKRGLWLRQLTMTSGGLTLNDSFANLGMNTVTDHVYIHDPVVYLLPPGPVSFGAGGAPGQVNRLWEARRIEWHALSDQVISATILDGRESGCPAGSRCDYGAPTHSYHYDPALTLPANPWRTLPGLATSDPDALPVAP